MLQSNRRVTALRSRNHETEVSNNKTALTRLWTCWLQTWGWLLLPPWPSAGRASDWWLPPSPPHPGAENQTDQSLHGATTTPRVPQGMGAMWPALLCHEKSGNSLKKRQNLKTSCKVGFLSQQRDGKHKVWSSAQCIFTENTSPLRSSYLFWVSSYHSVLWHNRERPEQNCDTSGVKAASFITHLHVQKHSEAYILTKWDTPKANMNYLKQ